VRNASRPTPRAPATRPLSRGVRPATATACGARSTHAPGTTLASPLLARPSRATWSRGSWP